MIYHLLEPELPKKIASGKYHSSRWTGLTGFNKIIFNRLKQAEVNANNKQMKLEYHAAFSSCLLTEVRSLTSEILLLLHSVRFQNIMSTFPVNHNGTILVYDLYILTQS